MKVNKYNPKEDISEDISYSPSEEIEEILTEANAYNLRNEVITRSRQLMETDSNLSLLSATKIAYTQLTQIK